MGGARIVRADSKEGGIAKAVNLAILWAFEERVGRFSLRRASGGSSIHAKDGAPLRELEVDFDAARKRLRKMSHVRVSRRLGRGCIPLNIGGAPAALDFVIADRDRIDCVLLVPLGGDLEENRSAGPTA